MFFAKNIMIHQFLKKTKINKILSNNIKTFIKLRFIYTLLLLLLFSNEIECCFSFLAQQFFIA